LRGNTTFKNYFTYYLWNSFSWKPNFEDDFSAKTEVKERMKTNMPAGYLTRES